MKPSHLSYILFTSSFISAILGVAIYPQVSPEVDIPKPIKFESLIPTRQSGIAEFSIPLPIEGWQLPVTVLCTIYNLTTEGIYQYAPVEIHITLTLQNFAAAGAVANQYIYISSFRVEPVNAIELESVIYNPSGPARFSSLWCIPVNTTGHKDINTPYQEFSDSCNVILQDEGLLELKIEPLIFPKNPTDRVWNDFNSLIDYKTTVSVPISVMSEFEAKREYILEQQQILQYKFEKLQVQQNERQKIMNEKGYSLSFFFLSIALLDIGVTILNLNKGKGKNEEQKTSNSKKQRKINDYV